MRVIGTLDDGAAYDVEVSGRTDRPVTGSRRVRALVEQHTGRPVLLGPHGPQRVLEATDTAAVLALLREHTTVVEAMA
ncbi:hypothetical protein KUF83_29920 [Streptomyces sp. BV286]|uniref:hypothetical protein n=1 Tax=Streptomyces sp. BV286 TaxID=2849672 RepID=UPI001C2EC4E0|nr:hypothetical protein [Streptomyces sp. BV286]MBV1940753.1 hypothetical protein [Streptomyces sp. BV286]